MPIKEPINHKLYFLSVWKELVFCDALLFSLSIAYAAGTTRKVFFVQNMEMDETEGFWILIIWE